MNDLMKGMLLGAGVAIVSFALAFGVFSASDEDAVVGTPAVVPTATACERFYQASAFLAGNNTSSNSVLQVAVLDPLNPGVGILGASARQLNQLLQQCLNTR